MTQLDSTLVRDCMWLLLEALDAGDTLRARDIANGLLAQAEPEHPPAPLVADGFDSPVGTADERAGDKVWPGEWWDASPYAQLYNNASAYHTGADLNLPNFADKGKPCYACASGVITFAGALPVWGNVVVLWCDPLEPGGLSVYARYGHLDTMTVKAGDVVARGDQIGTIGKLPGQVAGHHLHFDISQPGVTVLRDKPGDWPKLDRARLLRDYANPREWIRAHRPARG